jgi:hypothetical protein
MSKIFICYRREDTCDIAGRIGDRLEDRFGKENIFRDVDHIPLGVDFRKHLGNAVQGCEILIAVIGPDWLEAADTKGKPRLEDERDFVRIEIEAALQRDIPVIPVLVGGATMPAEEDLPPALKELAFRNGIEIHKDPAFRQDVDRLIRSMVEILEGRQLLATEQEMDENRQKQDQWALEWARQRAQQLLKEKTERLQREEEEKKQH